VSLFLLDGPAWPAVGHPFGAHHGCGGLLSWRWAPPAGVNTCGSVACVRCGAEHYDWPNGYDVDERNTADDLDNAPDAVPDADEDVYPDWVPSKNYQRESTHE